MKKILSLLTICACMIVSMTSSALATPEQEKAFVDSYRKAFEAKDEKALESFLYTKGSDPEALGFYKMMLTSDMGGKISKIELRDLTADESKKVSGTMPTPDGGKSKLPVTPTKKLVLSVESGDANGTSTSTSESFVANVDGKFLIPVPARVK